MANLSDTVKYLDYTGLASYDALIKKYSDDNDDAIIALLEEAIGEGGNVATQIENAISALEGTLSGEDSKTLEAINDELDGIDSALETLNGDDTTTGSVAKSIKDAIDALDYTIPSANHTEGKAVVAVTEANGKIAVTEGNIKADYVTVDWGTNDPVSTTANVQDSLDEIYATMAANATAGEVAVYEGGSKVSAIAADGKTYTIKQGTGTVATINIAKDMVVSSGSVITATGNETDVPSGTTLTAGQKYVRLVIKDSTDGKNIYIAVQDLYDDYTFTDGDEIDFTETNNEVTAVIKSGSIAKSKLTNALQNEITSARTTITEITQTDPATKHILVTKTVGTGANADNYVISENNIASASDLTAEVTRAKSAETAIDSAVGLTKAANAETRTWTPTTNYKASGSTHTVANNMAAIDAQLKSVSDFIGNMTAITTQEITALFTVSSGD